jgi:hypothetical protein
MVVHSKKNCSNTLLGFAILSFGLLFNADQAHAWGSLGHRTIATIASKIVRKNGAFWRSNASNMGKLTNVPDQYWKSGPGASAEKPTHWFQIDSYFTKPNQFNSFPHDYIEATDKYSEKSVIVNGTATWRINQFYSNAVAALKKNNYLKGLQMAGAMSHYVGDLSQPLHVSKNYDGQETNDPGIHKFFETINLENADADELIADVTDQAKVLLSSPEFEELRSLNPIDFAFEEVNRSFEDKDSIISADLKLGRGAKGSAAMLKIAKRRMADGAASLALLLEKISDDSGLTNDDGGSVDLQIPKWIAPEYKTKAPKSFYVASPVEELINDLNGASDCDQ